MDILHPEFVLFLQCAEKTGLRYLLIGGYAVNYYGYNRNTHDLDVWIAPTEDNKKAFINTLLCMNYSESEVAPLHNEDFTAPFKAGIGATGADIDILTYVHRSISFDQAEQEKVVFEIEPGLKMNFVSYDFLKETKLRSGRDKDLWDIAKLEELREKK